MLAEMKQIFPTLLLPGDKPRNNRFGHYNFIAMLTMNGSTRKMSRSIEILISAFDAWNLAKTLLSLKPCFAGWKVRKFENCEPKAEKSKSG